MAVSEYPDLALVYAQAFKSRKFLESVTGRAGIRNVIQNGRHYHSRMHYKYSWLPYDQFPLMETT